MSENYVKQKNKLNKSQREAIGLLSIGTFLEYFDLYLYIHMSVLLNELFFPKTDPITAQIITALTFSSTYIMRPIGGIVIGWIGDMMGRKSTIIITTSTMAVCCVVMAVLPTYNEIGFTASVVMISCRMLQGFSSLGESVGSKLYFVEMLKSPKRNVVVGFIGVFIQLGGMFALLIAAFSTKIAFNWRYAFFAGAVIAMVGVIARVRLRETPEFVKYKENVGEKDAELSKRVNKLVIFWYFMTELVFPFPFYIVYIYMGDVMKNQIGYSANDVIVHNTYVSFLSVVGMSVVSLLANRFHPIKIAFFTTGIFSVFIPFFPYWSQHFTTSWSCFLFQCVVLILWLPGSGLLESVFFRHFPVSKRFFCIATTFGVVNPISRILTSLGLIPLVYYFEKYALLILFAPASIIIFSGLVYFMRLERKSNNYFSYPD